VTALALTPVTAAHRHEQGILMSKPQMKNADSRSAALRPLVKAMRQVVRARKAAATPPPSLIPPRQLRFETMEPRLLLSADAPITIDTPEQQDGFARTLETGITVILGAPVATDDAGNAVEDGAAPVAGNVLDNDGVAAGGVLAVTNPGTFAGLYGTLNLAEDGSYSYVLNNESVLVQGLAAGESLSDSFSYSATDGMGTASAQLTIAIAGVNDAPFAADAFAYTGEDMLPAAAGNVLVISSDADFSNVLTVAEPGTYVGTYGMLTLEQDGSFQYLLDNESAAVQAVGAGQLGQDVFHFGVFDGVASSPAKLTILVVGMNDAPAAAIDEAATAEDSAPLAGNVLANDVDIDNGTVLTVTAPGVYEGNWGSLSLNADGSYVYEVANHSAAVQALAAGELVQDIFVYAATDGIEESTGFLLVSIFGSNDAPVTTDNTAAVFEDGVETASGNVLSDDSDVDAGTMLRIAAPGSYIGTFGVLTLNADGNYLYTLFPEFPAVQALAGGQVAQDTFDFAVTDGIALAPSRLVVAVTGGNDAPPVAADDFAYAAEDGAPVVYGNVLSNDRDGNGGGNLTVVGPNFHAGLYGDLTMAQDGSFAYTLNNSLPAVQALGAGAALTEVFTYMAFDGVRGVPAQLTVTIAGANDGPQAIADAVAATEDGGSVAYSAALLLANDTDIDESDTRTIVAVSNSAAGALVTWVNGNVVYDIGTLFQNLAQGEQFVDSFTYTMADAAGALSTARVSVTVTGANDAPQVVASTVAGTEDTPYVFSWSDFRASDADNNAVLQVVIATLPADGRLEVLDGSSWMAASMGQALSRTRIDAGELRFVPDANEAGSPAFAESGVGNRKQHYAQFGYQITDGLAASAVAIMTIDITPVADLPTLTIGAGTGGSSIELFRTGWESVANKNTQPTLERTVYLEGWLLAGINNKGQQGFDIWSTGDKMHDGKGAPSVVSADPGNGKNWLRLNTQDTPAIARIVSTQAGATYNLSFDYAGHAGAAAANTGVAVYVDGVKIGSFAGAGAEGGLSWQRINFSFTGKGGIQLIRIVAEAGANRAVGGAMIDDIALAEQVPPNTGAVNSTIQLAPISASLQDGDGSESLKLTINAIPAGATLTDGVRTFVATAALGAVDVTGWNLNNLSIRPATNFSGQFVLKVTATATETATGQSISKILDLAVTVRSATSSLPSNLPAAIAEALKKLPRIDWNACGLDALAGQREAMEDWLDDFLGTKRKPKDLLKSVGLKIKL
jgi:VCBS repeat-containing protein